MTDEQTGPTDPPGPTVRWETIAREYDAAGRLVSERTTVTTDTQIDNPEPVRHTGFYL